MLLPVLIPLIDVTFSTPTSFIIHYLGGQARNMFWGHLSEMLLYGASEATTFVNTCRLINTYVVFVMCDH